MSRREEFGAGISERNMASREASSMSSESSVETECKANVSTMTSAITNMRMDRRMVDVL